MCSSTRLDQKTGGPSYPGGPTKLPYIPNKRIEQGLA